MLEALLLAGSMEVVTEFFLRHQPPPTPVHIPCKDQLDCEKMAHNWYRGIDKKKYTKIRILICDLGMVDGRSKDCQVVYDETYP